MTPSALRSGVPSAFVAVTLRLKMEAAMKQQIADNLQVILNANAEAVHAWSTTVESDAEILAEDRQVCALVLGLLPRTAPGTPVVSQLLAAPELAALRARLNPWLDRRGFNGFVVLDTNCLVVASRQDQIVGMAAPPGYAAEFAVNLTGHSDITKPFPSVAMLAGRALNSSSIRRCSCPRLDRWRDRMRFRAACIAWRLSIAAARIS